MSTYGRQVLLSTGRNVMVAASDLGEMDWKPGGITLDWSTVAAVGSDTTLADDTVILNGRKGLRYGQILTKITQREVQTLTVTGTPTGGNTAVTAVIGGVSHPTTVVFNATAAVAQAAFDLVWGAGVVTVGGGALPGTALTITFNVSENVPLATNVDAYTGGSSPAAAITNTTAGTASRGSFGPYDPTATDGRQTLARGECYILNQTVLEHNALGLDVVPSDHPAVLDGGLVWKARLLITTGTHTLAAGPTVSEFEAAFPRIAYAQN